jgi:DNA replication protein DnaC
MSPHRHRPEYIWRWGPSGWVSPDGTEAPSIYQQLRNHLHYLELNTAAEVLSQELDRGLKEKASATQIMERIFSAQVQVSRQRRAEVRRRNAHFPVNKTLQNFDFDFQPSIDRHLIAELSTLRFIEEKRNVIIIGPPGVGKTHLAIALGICAVEAGYRAYYATAADLVSNLQNNYERGTMAKAQRTYFVGPPLLVIDELGYLPMDHTSATWMFHVVSKRYEKGSIIVTSNRGFADWSQIFNDPVVASAIVDRLIHNAVVINIRGASYRMRTRRPIDQSDDRLVGYEVPTYSAPERKTRR